MILGIIGGIFGIFVGIFAVIVGGLGSLFGASNTHIASSGAFTVLYLGLGAVVLGVLGIVGGAIVNKNKKLAGSLMLATGLSGFITTSTFWIIPGFLLMIGGILAFLTKDEDAVKVTVPN